MNLQNNDRLPYRILNINADTLTPIGIFKRLKGKNKVLLESTFDHDNQGKYSYIGSNPYQEVIGIGDRTTCVDHLKNSTQVFKINALDYLKEKLPRLDIELPLPFTGGAIGYVGYDSIREFEDIGELLPDELDMPDSHFMLYQDLIIFDHQTEQLSLVVMNIDQSETEILDSRINVLKEALHSEEDFTELGTDELKFSSKINKQDFEDKVRIAQDFIKKGECSQIVISKRMEAEINSDPFSYYRKLRIANPSPYMFYLDFGDYVIVGASPESLIRTEGRNIIANPIAGTRPRGKTSAEDKALVNDLLADQKEISEHEMLVELSQNDLERVCEAHSITVPVNKKVEMFQHVMHIVSEVHGILKPDLTSIDVLIASLPAGTVSGTPKLRAMQIINELETEKRGFYGGGVGYINFNHDLNLALAIRSLIIKEDKAYLQSGAGIVLESDPETEYMETIHKARSLTEIYKNKAALTEEEVK